MRNKKRQMYTNSTIRHKKSVSFSSQYYFAVADFVNSHYAINANIW